MNRSQRRAAMRLTQKSVQTPPVIAPSAATPQATQISDIQLAANQKNAQLSTGPTTDAGKAVSSLNALKTGLTGRTVLMPSEDAAEYQTYIQAHKEEFQPVGVIESDLVQSIADTAWRLRRISTLEHAVFAKGRLEFADQFKGQDPGLLDLHTTEVYDKALRNFHLQENRLGRRREKEIAELRGFQAVRLAKQEAALAEAAALYEAAQAAGTEFTPAPSPNGFLFSTTQIERFIAAKNPQTTVQKEQKAANAVGA